MPCPYKNYVSHIPEKCCIIPMKRGIDMIYPGYCAWNKIIFIAFVVRTLVRVSFMRLKGHGIAVSLLYWNRLDHVCT